MRLQRYRVTTSIQGHKQVQIWDCTKPLNLDRDFKWILEANSTGIHLRYLKGPVNQIEKDCLFKIDPEFTLKGKTIKLPQNIEVQVKKIRGISPAFSTLRRKYSTENKYDQLLVFSGTGSGLNEFTPIHKAYVGYSRKKPVFTFQNSGEKYIIKPLFDGLVLKKKGEKPLFGKPSDQWTLDINQIGLTTFWYGTKWWRFKLVYTEHDFSHNLQEREDSFLKEQASWKFLGIAGSVFLGLSALVYLIPPSIEKENKLPSEPPVVEFVLPKTKVEPIPQPKQPIPEPEKKPIATPQKEKPLASSKPTHSKTASSKPPEKPRNVAKPLPQPHSNQAAKSIQDALQGALQFVQKEKGSAPPLSAPNPSTQGVFSDSHSSQIGATELKPRYSGSSSKLTSLEGSRSIGAEGSKTKGGTHFGNFYQADSAQSTVEEGLTKEEVGAVIHQHMDEVRYCYESAILYQPKIEGKLVVQFIINKTGVVDSSKVLSSTLNQSHLENCILKKLATWKFPHPRNGSKVTVSYPFLFKTLARGGGP